MEMPSKTNMRTMMKRKKAKMIMNLLTHAGHIMKDSPQSCGQAQNGTKMDGTTRKRTATTTKSMRVNFQTKTKNRLQGRLKSSPLLQKRKRKALQSLPTRIKTTVVRQIQIQTIQIKRKSRNQLLQLRKRRNLRKTKLHLHERTVVYARTYPISKKPSSSTRARKRLRSSLSLI